MHTHLTPRLGLGALCTAGLLALGGLFAGPSAASAGAPGAEALRALIYYMDHNDQRSVQAEMRRLRAQYPRWTPPSDLNELRSQTQASTAAVDVAPIWSRIERSDWAGARALIEQTQASAPNWSPDAEMQRLVAMGEAQSAFDAAYAARQADGVIAAARGTPAIMRCDRINNAWRLAEMYNLNGQRAAAVETYRGVAGACSRRADVVATLEKANEVATWPEMEEIIAVARRTGPSNAEAIDAVVQRLRAGRGQGGAPSAGAPSAPRTSSPTAAAAPAAAAPSPSRQRAVAAPAGLTSLPLRGDGRLATVRNHKEAGRWAECTAGSTGPRSLEILYERSWCVYNLDRPGEALMGFTLAEGTGNQLGPNVNRDARFGMILSYLAMNMTEAGARLSAATPLTDQQRIEVETTILDQRSVRAYQGRDYAAAIRYFDALESVSGSLRRDLAMMRGYAYLNLGQNDLAHQQFQRLHAQLATDETRAALRAVTGRLGG